MTFIVHSWGKLHETFEARASEWVLSAIMISLGLLFIYRPIDLYLPASRTIIDLADPVVWSTAFLVIGLGRLLVLLVNGAWWRTPHFRSLFAFVSCFVWFQLFWGIADYVSMGLAILPWIFLLDVYNAFRAGREAGIVEYIHSQRHRKGMRDANGN